MPDIVSNKIETVFIGILLLFSVLSGFLIYSSIDNRAYQGESHLVLLAEQLTKFRLDLNPSIKLQNDFLDYQGKLYLYFGPFSIRANG